MTYCIINSFTSVWNLTCIPPNEVATLVQLFGSVPRRETLHLDAFGKSGQETEPLRMMYFPLKMVELFLKSAMESPVNIIGVCH